jgi:hypothetical protein
MKRNIVAFAFSVLTVGPVIAAPGAQGKGGSGGGDLCEKRIQDIRDDIKNWLVRGGANPENGLVLPTEVSPDSYKYKMLTQPGFLKTNRQPDGSLREVTDLECVHHPIEIQGHEKVCRFDHLTSGPKITCYYEGFLDKKTMTEDDQYQLIHHEFAGLAGFEPPSGSQSTYVISNQISSYLETVSVRKLSLKRPLKEADDNPLQNYFPLNEVLSGKCQDQNWNAIMNKLLDQYVILLEKYAQLKGFNIAKIILNKSTSVHIHHELQRQKPYGEDIPFLRFSADVDFHLITTEGTDLVVKFRNRFEKMSTELNIYTYDYVHQEADREGNLQAPQYSCEPFISPEYIEIYVINKKYSTEVLRVDVNTVDGIL